jgi:hypothetical protein
MQSIPQSASASLTVLAEGLEQSQKERNPEELVYQALTVAAIVLLLGSLWVF